MFLKGVGEGLSVKIRCEQRPDDEESLMKRHTSWGRAHWEEKQAQASGEISLAKGGRKEGKKEARKGVRGEPGAHDAEAGEWLPTLERFRPALICAPLRARNPVSETHIYF